MVGASLFAQNDAPQIIAHFPFNGDSKDIGSGNFPYINSAINWGADKEGSPQSAAYFNGDISFININDEKGLLPNSNFSICGWFKIDSIGLSNLPQTLISKYNLSGERSLKIQVKAGDKAAISTYIYEMAEGQNIKKKAQKTNKLTAFSSAEMTYEWQHFCLTFSDDYIMTLYLNGDLKQQSEQLTGPMHLMDMPVSLGLQYNPNNPNEGNYPFKGAMDDLRFYYGVLDECEVNELYYKNDIVPAKRVKDFVNDDLSVWTKLRADETTEAHEKRLADSLDWRAWKLERKIINRIKQEIIWQCGDLTYQADSQRFELHYKHCNPVYLKVPQADGEAKSFEDNFKKLEYTKTKLALSGSDFLEVECLEIYNPARQKNYTLGNCNNDNLVFFKDTTSVEEERKKYTGRKVDVLKTIEVKSKTITIEVWDDRREDGDVIGLVLNDEWILQGYEVTNEKKVMEIKLPKGNNKLVMFARNQGLIPPNTAVLQINDGHRKQKVWMRSDFSRSGAINIKVK